jgi:hypothetical protein
MPTVGTAMAASDHHHHKMSCPAPESLIPGTKFTHRTLAKGVTVSAGTAKDAKGSVNVHVLRVDLTQPRVSMVPLLHSIANRQPLSQLAAHRSHLVAATNTGYFDFAYGAPTDPLIVNGKPLVISNQPQSVVGIGKNGRMESGNVWAQSAVTVGKTTQALTGTNEVNPPDGLSAFNSRWGTTRVPTGSSSSNRLVVGGDVADKSRARAATVPHGGYVLHARGHSAAGWLSSLTGGSKINVTTQLKTTAASPFAQAYGVGVQLVAKHGVARTGLSCDSANTKTPARTAIGWSHGGRKLVVALVSDHPHTSSHGLDPDQMSKLMVQLGVDQAWSWDGSGSTELLAKFPHSSSLRLQTYPSDGAERPMPVGMGISVAPAKAHKHR